MLSERQQQIVEASIKLIDEKGIQGFTIKNLSKEIGISEPGLYRHFDSKMLILSAILDSFRLNISEYDHQNRESRGDSPDTLIRKFFRMIFKLFSENPALVSVIFAEEIFQNEPSLTAKVMEIQEFNEKKIGAILRQLPLNEKLQNAPPATINLMFFGSVRLLTRKWKLENRRFNLITEGDHLIETILKAIL